MKALESFSKKTAFIIVITILLGINGLLSFIPWKVDFSLGTVYSLSPSSKQVLKGLKKKATITIYMSSALPPRVAPVKKDVLDLMDEYKAYGGTKLSVQTVFPDKDPKKEQEAAQSGVQRMQFSEVESDKFSLKNGFFGAVITYEDKKEVIPSLLNPSSLEIDITSALYRMSRQSVPVVGVIGGQTNRNTTLFSELLQKQFDVRDVTPTTLKTYELDGLIYKDDRKTSLTDTDIEQMDSFAKSGKPLIILADGMWVDDSLLAGESKSNINSLLKKYDLHLNSDLVLSNNAETASFRSGFLNYITKYPYWVRVGGDVFGSSLSFVGTDTMLILPWASSVQQKNIKKTISLIYAPEGSWKQVGAQSVLPTNVPSLPREQLSKLVVGAESNAGVGKLVVIGNSRFVEDDFNSRSVGNIDFVSKLLDTYLSKGILSSIKYRGVSFIPISEVTDNAKQTMRYVNVIAPGLLFALFGYYLTTKRKKN